MLKRVSRIVYFIIIFFFHFFYTDPCRVPYLQQLLNILQAYSWKNKITKANKIENALSNESYYYTLVACMTAADISYRYLPNIVIIWYVPII